MTTATDVIVPLSLAKRRALAAIERARAALADGIGGFCGDCESAPEGACYAHMADRDASAWLGDLGTAIKAGDGRKAALLAGTEKVA
jgi:hypothetical protein